MKQPLFLSFFLHTLLLLAFLLVFLTKEQVMEDVPVEITEFIRNLGNPEPKKQITPKKKSNEQPTVQSRTAGDSVKGESTAAPSSSSSSNAGGESVSEDYEVSEMPILLNEVRVPYPAEARSRNVQGNVVFDILISSEGKVKDLKVLSSPNSILTLAAQNAVSLFRFRPAKMGDKFVAIRIRYTYRFLLQ